MKRVLLGKCLGIDDELLDDGKCCTSSVNAVDSDTESKMMMQKIDSAWKTTGRIVEREWKADFYSMTLMLILLYRYALIKQSYTWSKGNIRSELAAASGASRRMTAVLGTCVGHFAREIRGFFCSFRVE